MRSASRVFYAIAVFAVIAALLFSIGTGFDNVQGMTILGAFALASAYLGLLLGKQAAHDLVGLEQPDDGHGDEPIHLPPPSWMPAGYSVACALTVLGLAFWYPLLWVGVASLVLVSVGWARESVVEYRREVAHHKPAALTPAAGSVALARQLVGFRVAHGGADAVVQHIGRGFGEVVTVGKDGSWGSFEAPTVDVGREAVRLAGLELHQSWPQSVGARVAPDRELWLRMGSSNPFRAPKERVPFDGSTQVAARVFLAIGVFAVIAAALFWSGQRDIGALQGTAILSTFALANFYLWYALKHAKARPEDAAFVDDRYVTREPEQPPHMDPATLHLPGPSWMPALYSLAAALIVLGLAFQLTLLAVGVVLLVAATIGWGVESVREYRALLAHGGHGSSPDALHGSPNPFKH